MLYPMMMIEAKQALRINHGSTWRTSNCRMIGCLSHTDESAIQIPENILQDCLVSRRCQEVQKLWGGNYPERTPSSW
uniref:Uncharacterized protein n=1 Tax=Arion vulgaris TaxID=1028688 RepID=A0A0B6ZJN8_9EUPU